MIQIMLLVPLISASMEEHVWKNLAQLLAATVQWDLMVTDAILTSYSVDQILASMEALVLKGMELLYCVIAQRGSKVTNVKMIVLSADLTRVSMEAPVSRVSVQ
jgi:hypothetical protein